MALYDYGHREFPAASYDRWKTTPPDDWYGHGDEEPEDECLHEEFDYDILTGRASCFHCDHDWYLTDAQLKAMLECARTSERDMERQSRWWFRLWQDFRARWRYRLMRFRSWRQRRRVDLDDEIPF